MKKTYKFFTGENCSPCKALKARIEELQLHDSFDVLDVTQNVNEACKYHVRSLPHIVCSDGTHYLGLVDGLALLEMMSDLNG